MAFEQTLLRKLIPQITIAHGENTYRVKQTGQRTKHEGRYAVTFDMRQKVERLILHFDTADVEINEYPFRDLG